MTECQDCRQQVRFVLLGTKPDGSNKWTPPLDLAERVVKERKSKGAEPFVHQGFVVTETFTIHNCPGRMDREARHLLAKQMAEQRAGKTEEGWVEALKRDCPKCGSRVNERCINLSDVRRGYASPHNTRHPHIQRLPPGWYEQRVTE